MSLQVQLWYVTIEELRIVLYLAVAFCHNYWSNVQLLTTVSHEYNTRAREIALEIDKTVRVNEWLMEYKR